MSEKIIRLVFFGNYFVGILAIALSIETDVQLHLPVNSPVYYILLFSGTVMYYTYAYSGALQSSSPSNLRSDWYSRHHTLVRFSQGFLFMLFAISAILIFTQDIYHILCLPVIYWLVILALLILSLFYYGLLPGRSPLREKWGKYILGRNLRSTGWLKAFVIGCVWAGSVGLAPVVALRMAGTPFHTDPLLVIWLFIKNWMFCTVNAIIFDIKDYDDDSNKQLKTFVVRFGLRNTIFFVLIPLSLVSLFFMLAFERYRHFGWLPVTINLLPFLLLLWVSYSMQRQKSIFYYLIVIDGLVFIKALCGIIAMQFAG